MQRDDLFFRLYEDLCHAPVIDTHEHLPLPAAQPEAKKDVLSEYLSHYMSSDLVSAGLSLSDLAAARDVKKPLEARWLKIEPYWQACRFTGYARALDRSVKILYDIDGLQRHTILPLDRAFQKANKPGWRWQVMRERCRIHACLNDAFVTDPQDLGDDPAEWIHLVWRPEPYYYQRYDRESLQRLAQRQKLPRVKNLADFQDLLAADFAKARAKRLRAIKIGSAYDRSLAFPQPPRSEAARSFAAFLEKIENKPARKHLLPRPVQNFMLHEILRLAAGVDCVVQVHTGLQEGNGNRLQHSQPLLLNELFLRHPQVRFDLFHIGYPYIGETCALAKNFAGVHIDMCWSHIIAPQAARRALSEFIDAVPANKISAFGGDYLFVDAIAGHLDMARENVASVLADKVRQQVMAEDQARILGRRLFFDHPKKLFGI